MANRRDSDRHVDLLERKVEVADDAAQDAPRLCNFRKALLETPSHEHIEANVAKEPLCSMMAAGWEGEP